MFAPISNATGNLCMNRDPRSFLWDARESADTILQFIAGVSVEQYIANDMLRAAVERHFEIVGEALGSLAKLDSELAARVPDLKGAVAFRNSLIHGYSVVDDRIVWQTTQEKLPKLRNAIDALLTDLEQGQT